MQAVGFRASIEFLHPPAASDGQSCGCLLARAETSFYINIHFSKGSVKAQRLGKLLDTLLANVMQSVGCNSPARPKSQESHHHSWRTSGHFRTDLEAYLTGFQDSSEGFRTHLKVSVWTASPLRNAEMGQISTRYTILAAESTARSHRLALMALLDKCYRTYAVARRILKPQLVS